MIAGEASDRVLTLDCNFGILYLQKASPAFASPMLTDILCDEQSEEPVEAVSAYRWIVVSVQFAADKRLDCMKGKYRQKTKYLQDSSNLLAGDQAA